MKKLVANDNFSQWNSCFAFATSSISLESPVKMAISILNHCSSNYIWLNSSSETDRQRTEQLHVFRRPKNKLSHNFPLFHAMVVVVFATLVHGGWAAISPLKLTFMLRLYPPESTISKPNRDAVEEVPREAIAATPNRSRSRNLALKRRSIRRSHFSSWD